MSASDWLGIIGGLAGLLALALEGYGYWKKRKPHLALFVPYHFTGNESHSKQRILFALVRVSNTSERAAHLYLETLRAEVLFKGRWYQMSVPSFPLQANMEFDLPEPIQHHTGVNHFQFFNKFDAAIITLDNPYSRYVGMTCIDRGVVDNAERLRLEVKDCNLIRYVIEADILRNDPEHSEKRG